MRNEELKVNTLETVDSAQQKEEVDVSEAISKPTNAPLAQAVGKTILNGNPLVSHKFGADPYALVYEDRVYLYATNDVFQYDESGNVKDNTYANINKLSVISSDDLVNWTDHGFIDVAGLNSAAKWATQSWAPAAVHKVIDGKDKFFIYFANNASNIGVLMSDSPTGPWIDPIGKPLLTRETPGVEKVTWLFDPAVLVDDDGKAYIYFGGGIPEGQEAMPNTARVMELGDDMISVLGEALPIPAPYMFENSGINKVNNKYYYTYCSNFYDGVRPEGSPQAGQISYMVSDSPMGPWTYEGIILKNPVHFFDIGGNNHHAIFEFHDSWYIAYHAQTLSKAMGVAKGYRSTHLNQVFFNEDGTIQEIIADYEGVKQLKTFNPYVRVEAETIGWQAGINTEQISDNAQQSFSNRVVTDIDNGDWIAVSNVDFGNDGASSFTAAVANGSAASSIEIRLDSPDGKLIGELSIPAVTDEDQYSELQTKIEGANGVHHLFLVFRGEENSQLFKLNYWQFQE
ncbi:MAG TPA: family 43 glycosylhydrolase [Candidatus Paenibacillus intestinavium]|nr:family 43 glycosylhydrolase [Candidatus Paenibacillus intestinavium]